MLYNALVKLLNEYTQREAGGSMEIVEWTKFTITTFAVHFKKDGNQTR
jgi:hypothetical protein